MRFEKGHKEKTRKRILEVASRRMRREGIAASGIASIMNDAGLTNGAFYLHFDSKEALVREAVESALSEQCEKLAAQGAEARSIEDVIREYLKPSHVLDPDEGCPSAALLPELGREPQPTREAYEAGLLRYVSMLASYLPDPESEASRQRAIAVFGMMVGTLQLARGVSDVSLSGAILEGGAQAAISLAKLPL